MKHEKTKRIKLLFLGPEDEDLSSYFEKRADKVSISHLSDKINKVQIEEIKPDLIVSYGYKHIIRPEIFDNFRTINLHISYLPYNRGSNPNFWSFYDNTAKGVTIHEVAKSIDSGNIIKQKKILFSSDEFDLERTYQRLKREMSKLFVENWETIVYNKHTSNPQDLSKGSYYTKKDFLPFSCRLRPGWKTKTSEIMKWKKEQI